MAEGNGRQWSEKTLNLGREIMAMSVAEAKELGDYLKEEHGIEPAGGGVAMMAPMTGVPAQEEAAAEPTEFNVVLEEFGAEKIKVIKVVRELTSLGLKEAKELVESAPKPVKEAVSKEDAEKFKKQLEEVGAKVSIKPA